MVFGRQTVRAAPHVDVALVGVESPEEGPLPRLLQGQQTGGGGDRQGLGPWLLVRFYRDTQQLAN